NFGHKLYSTSYGTIRDDIVSKAISVGLVPYTTEVEDRALQRRNRWVDLQMSPMERYAPIKTAEGLAWEVLYQDGSMKSSFPEIYKMWKARAEAMQLNKRLSNGESAYLFDFQFENIINVAAKGDFVMGDQMGLGKTRQ